MAYREQCVAYPMSGAWRTSLFSSVMYAWAAERTAEGADDMATRVPAASKITAALVDVSMVKMHLMNTDFLPGSVRHTCAKPARAIWGEGNARARDRIK